MWPVSPLNRNNLSSYVQDDSDWSSDDSLSGLTAKAGQRERADLVRIIHYLNLTVSKHSRYRTSLSFIRVLRIHDIFVWIRIRIGGSMLLTNESGCGSGSFSFHN